MTKYLNYLFFVALIFTSTAPAYADIPIPAMFYFHSPRLLLQCITAGQGPAKCNIGPAQIISLLLPNTLILAGVIFFLLIIGGGFSLISSAGKESSAQDKARAQGAITYGVIGFLLVVSAYFILQIVGTVTGLDFINTSLHPI